MNFFSKLIAIMLVTTITLSLYTSCRLIDDIIELAKGDENEGVSHGNENGTSENGESSGGSASGGDMTDEELDGLLAAMAGKDPSMTETPVTGNTFSAIVVPRPIQMVYRGVKFYRGYDYEKKEPIYEYETQLAPDTSEYGKNEDSQTIYLLLTDGYQWPEGVISYTGGSYSFGYIAPEGSVDEHDIRPDIGAYSILLYQYMERYKGLPFIEAKMLGTEFVDSVAKEKLWSAEVKVMSDVVAGDVDNDGRLLCHIVPNKTGFAASLNVLFSGKGRYTDIPPYNSTLMGNFKKAEDFARQNNIGIWK